MRKGGFIFVIMGALWLLSLLPIVAWAQDKKQEKAMQSRKALPTTVMGVVIDAEANEPLPGATVRFKNTTVGVISDAEGKFRMTVPEKGKVLTVSFVGKTTVDVPLKSGTTHYKILLEDQNAVSGEVVVTGYRSISKTRMTGAAESVTSKDIANKGFSSVGDILRGSLSGVSTRLSSGKLGETPEIRIRGLNSMNVSGVVSDMNPIWVVDGVLYKGNLNDLIPEDIESINVLKDAAATALYGSQAANGVIVVQRKSGKAGKARIQITSSFSFEEAPSPKLHMMTTAEKIAFERQVYEDFPTLAKGGRVMELLRNADMGKITHEEAENEISRLSKIQTDWYDVLFRSPFSQNHNLSLSGGTNQTSYYLSLGMRNSHGVAPVNNLNNYNALMRIQHKLTQRLQVFFDLSANIRKDKDSAGGSSLVSYAMFANPYERPYDENGNVEYDRSYANALSSLKDGYKVDYNILEELKNNTTETSALSARASVGFEWNILDKLRYSTTFAFNSNYSNTERILAPGTATSKNSSWIASIYSELPDDMNNGQLTETDARSESWTWQNRLSYSFSIKDKHHISMFAGHEVSEFRTNNNYTLYPEYNPDLGTFDVPAFSAQYVDVIRNKMKTMLSVSESLNRAVSFFAALDYSYQDRYIISASARMDGADVIATDNRFSPLWNVSFRYNMQKEPFMQKLKWLSMLAFRASYGYTGSINRTVYPYNLLSYSTSNKFLGVTVPSYITPKNPDIKWQKKEDRSFGLEVSFLKNRFQFVVNYYNNVIRDLIDNLSLPASNGITTIKANSSSVANIGWEFNVRTVNYRSRSFTWITTFNLATNESKVIKSYYKRIEDIPKGSLRTEPVEGSSTNSWLGYRFAGIDPLTGHTLAFVDNTNRETPIGFQREDGSWVLDMDNAANEEDKLKIKEVLGKSYPPVTGGFGSTIQWKRFSLDCHFSFMTGHLITSAYYSVATGSISSASLNVHPLEAYRWRKPGDITNVPAYNTSGLSSSLQTDYYDRKLEKGDFLKCTQISLGYHLPNKLCKAVKLKSARVNLNLRDVFTITGYKGLDPENFGSYGYPISRKYMLSLSIGF
ncbi:MAG: SusC/RagA family TonB-linked outer membrane protein [Prevotellaceae bacterium]|nr:SusC/RagA family TonB-linked outer membrane protein [Prevotellaceae bacterium]